MPKEQKSKLLLVTDKIHVPSPRDPSRRWGWEAGPRNQFLQQGRIPRLRIFPREGSAPASCPSLLARPCPDRQWRTAPGHATCLTTCLQASRGQREGLQRQWAAGGQGSIWDSRSLDSRDRGDLRGIHPEVNNTDPARPMATVPSLLLPVK